VTAETGPSGPSSRECPNRDLTMAGAKEARHMTYVVAEAGGDRWIVTWLRGRLASAWVTAAVEDARRQGAKRVRIVYIGRFIRETLHEEAVA
jgi:hypothetical protein